MKCKQRNRCNSNMMRVTSTLALATGLLFPAPIAIQASGMQNANISVQQDNVTTGRIMAHPINQGEDSFILQKIYTFVP